jgi:predicted dehydrogenase
VYLSDRAGRRELPVPADARLPAPRARRDDPRYRYTHLELGPYTRLCAAFCARIDGRDEETTVPVPTFADGLANSRVLDLIRASAAAGGALRG